MGGNYKSFMNIYTYLDDIEMFGSPKNFETGIWENRLIYVGKQHASSIQKRGPKVFTRQLGNRIHVKQCSEKCKQYINTHLSILSQPNVPSEDNIGIDNEGLSSYGPPKLTSDYHISVLFNREIVAKWDSPTKAEIPPLIISFIKQYYGTPNNQVTINIFCEFSINQLVYRCHPNYRGGGPWYDWCIVSFELSDEDQARTAVDYQMQASPAYPPGHYPCKLLAVFKNENNHWMCIVHCCSAKTDSAQDSCLTEVWYLEYETIVINQMSLCGNGTGKIIKSKVNKNRPLLRVVPCEAIRDRVYVVEENPGVYDTINPNDSTLVVLVKKRSLWPPYFTYMS
jgi:hypothetical protein